MIEIAGTNTLHIDTNDPLCSPYELHHVRVHLRLKRSIDPVLISSFVNINMIGSEFMTVLHSTVALIVNGSLRL